MIGKFRKYIIQGALDKTDDIFERSKIESTFNLNFGFIILYSLMLGYMTNLPTSFEFDLVNWISWLWTLSVLFIIRWTKSPFWSGIWFVFMGMCTSTTMVFLSGGMATLETGAWHTFGIITGFLLVNRKWGYIISTYFVGLTVFVVINQTNDLGLFDIGLSMGVDPGQDPVATAIPMIASAYMIARFLRTRNKAQELIAEQKERAERQRTELALKNQEITDSITYSKRIQTGILPSKQVIEGALKESFVLYLPKDIVAGDFYWLHQQNDGRVLYAAADCTGHGVPGAMVSVVCSSALNRCVQEFKITEPGKILDKARDLVVETFEASEENVMDGMDVALCGLDGVTLDYAGANNPLCIVRNGEVLETKPNKQPVGKYHSPEPFKTHELSLEPNDMVYIFSDGYADQFGGPKGKKFKTKALKQLLVDISSLSMQEQKLKLEERFNSWKGELEQIDDVCIFGVRVSSS